jgi:hypothetical protein
MFNKTGNATDFCDDGMNSNYDPFRYDYPAFKSVEVLGKGSNGRSIYTEHVICGFPTSFEKAKIGKCTDYHDDIIRLCPCDNNCEIKYKF